MSLSFDVVAASDQNIDFEVFENDRFEIMVDREYEPVEVCSDDDSDGKAICSN